MRMDNRCDDLTVEESEIQRIRKTGNDRAPLVVMHRRERQRELTDSVDRGLDRSAKSLPEIGMTILELPLSFEQLVLRSRAEDDNRSHRPPESVLRTSSHGMAVDGSASCSAKRRSSSATNSGVNSNEASRSASSRLSQRASAKSARSLDGNLSSASITSGAMMSSSHESDEQATVRHINDYE